MQRYISKCWRNTKIALACSGGIFSTTLIIIGLVATKGLLGVAMAVGGSFWLASSGFLLFDGTRVLEMIKKDIERLEDSTKSLESNVRVLEGVKDNLLNMSERYRTQVERLTAMKIEYEQSLRLHGRLLEDEKATNQQLEESLLRLEKTKASLIKNAKELTYSLKSNKKVVEELKMVRDEYKLQNDKLQSTAEQNTEELEHLKTQVSKLKELYNNTKVLMRNLATAGDMFTEFSATIGSAREDLDDTREGYDKTLDKMNMLLDRMKNSTFKDIDIDGDGIVSKDEYNDYINS
jgi:chromosome segregation ATPase